MEIRARDLDLTSFRVVLEETLRQYERMHDNQLYFGAFDDLKLTTDKPNTARTKIPVDYSGTPVGDMYVLLFMRGDGTGDNNTFGLDDLLIPEELKHSSKPEKVLPRSKRNIICEGILPMFSLSDNPGKSGYRGGGAQVVGW